MGWGAAVLIPGVNGELLRDPLTPKLLQYLPVFAKTFNINISINCLALSPAETLSHLPGVFDVGFAE